MAGLLPFLGTEFDDPKTQGILGLGLALLGARGSTAEGLSRAGLAGLQGYQFAQSAQDQRQSRELARQAQQMQIDQLRAAAERQRRLQEIAAQSVRPAVDPATLPSVMTGSGQRTPEQNAAGLAAVQAAAAPTFDFERYAQGVAAIDPMLALDVQARLKKDVPAPIKLGQGEQLLDPKTFRPIANNPKPEDKPTLVREYEYAKAQGYPGTFQQFEVERRRAGASNVNVVNAERPLVNTIATGLGTQLDTSLSQAREATSAISTAQTLRQAVESGKVVAGPLASFRVLGLQVGQMMGVNGKDQNEVLLNTRTAIQAMAKAELDAAQMMKGQGQITEAERDIIRRAAAGNIDGMTAPELSLLAQTMEKTARNKIARHQQSVRQLQAIPGAAPLMPFYNVEMPPERPTGAAGAAGGNVLRFDAQGNLIGGQ